MTISQAELETLLARLTTLSEDKRITWRRLSPELVQLDLPEFRVELARLRDDAAEGFRLAVQTQEGLPEGELEVRDLLGVRTARLRRDLGYLFDIALSGSVSDTVTRLFSQLPDSGD